MTARICRALAHPAVTMLGHATGRLLLRRDPYEVDMDAVIETAAQHGKIIEINSHPYRLDMDWRLWQQARSLGVQCSINPDAHSVEDLQSLAIGIGVARKGWLRKQDVVNCLTVKQVERLFQRGK